MREAGHESCANRIAGVRHHDRDRSRRALSRQGCWRARGHNDIDPETGQLVREAGEVVGPTVR